MLEVAMYTTINTLFNKGYSKSKIVEMLNVNRKTVGKVLKEIDEKGYVERKKKPSMLDSYNEYLKIQANKDLSAMRIFQDMQREFGRSPVESILLLIKVK